MTDKELLELAAKAAGIEIISDAEEKGLWIKHKFLAWNPLTDDADALRLAVKLGINILTYPIHNPDDRHSVIARIANPLEAANPTQVIEEYGDDPYAATRRAIVRAASEIGRGME